jgi:hypothetical protein
MHKSIHYLLLAASLTVGTTVMAQTADIGSGAAILILVRDTLKNPTLANIQANLEAAIAADPTDAVAITRDFVAAMPGKAVNIVSDVIAALPAPSGSLTATILADLVAQVQVTAQTSPQVALLPNAAATKIAIASAVSNSTPVQNNVIPGATITSVVATLQTPSALATAVGATSSTIITFVPTNLTALTTAVNTANAANNPPIPSVVVNQYTSPH